MSTINFLRIALISKRAEFYGYEITADEEAGTVLEVTSVRPENPTIFMSVTGEWVAELTADQLLEASDGMRSAYFMLRVLNSME